MRLRTFLIAALLVGGFVYFTTRQDSPMVRRVSQALTPESAPLWSGPTVAHSAGLGSDELNNIDIYKNAKDSVVYVTSTVYQTTFFFEQVPVKEMGSGFFINGDGQILTNNHVISGSSQVEVTLPDQSQYKAKILVRDRVNDLALIKIEPKKKLTYLTLGDSDRLQVGQKVLAIGNPFGLQGTLTVGVVSSLARTIKNENGENLEGIIQTDAAINSGNSGGPLLDSQGNVVGLNTAIYSPNNGGNLGIGFAMPINRAKAMLDDFRGGKKPATRLIGISVWPVSGDLAEALRLPSSGGLLVVRVARGSIADRAGLHGPTEVTVIGNTQVPIGGDLITSIDGKTVEEADAISKATSRKHAGETMNLKVYRGGKTLNVGIVLGDAAEERF
jgi:S1-C subfamily serine protease